MLIENVYVTLQNPKILARYYISRYASARSNFFMKTTSEYELKLRFMSIFQNALGI